MFELGVTIWIPCALFRLAVRLQTVTREFQECGDSAIRHGVMLSLKFFRQLAGALACPAQRRFWMAARHGINQGIKCCSQSRIDFGQFLATTSRTANPSADRLIGLCPATFQVAYTHCDRVPCQAGGDGNGRDTAPTQCHRFGSGPLSPHPLVHHWGQSEKLFPDPLHRGCVPHALTM
jgi:hypothetical protein